jgi:MFS family permease
MTQRRVVIALGTAQTLGWGSTFYLPAILATPMADGLGLSTSQIYAAFSVGLAVSAVLGPAAGRRIDRLGGRETLAAANGAFAAGLLMLGLATGPVMLFAAWIVIGIGMAFGLYEAAFATVTRIYGRDARSAITGITLIAGFASTVAWPVTAALDASLGWRGACLVWAGVQLAVALPLNLSLPRGEPAGPAMPKASAGPAPLDPAMLLLGFVFAATWFVSTAMAAHLPRLLESAGAAPAAAIAAAALVGPAQVAARFLEFSLLRKLDPLISSYVAAICHPVGAAALLVAGAPAAAPFAVLHGAGNGVLTIARGTVPLALFGPEGYGLRQGWLAAPARLAAVFAPASFALLIERIGAGALWVSASLGLISLGALLLLPLMARRAT